MTDSDAELAERDRPSGRRHGVRRRWSRSVRRWGLALGSVLSLYLLLSAFVIQPFLIPSGSMESTLRIGDRVLVNKLAYRFGGEIERGDIVVFDGTGSFVTSGGDPGPLGRLLRTAGATVGLAEPRQTDYVKRVIGVGGDRVTCCDREGHLLVNGAPLAEPYVHPGDAPSAVSFDIRVPEGRLWVMGDHRSDSSDSRDHLGSPGGGTVPEERVIGRAEFVAWPPARWGAPEGADG